MRLFYFILLILSSCSSISAKKDYFSSWNNIREFEIGKTSEYDIISKLGISSSKIDESQSYVLYFKDPKNNFETLGFSFSKQTKKLIGIMWIPITSQDVQSLENARTLFPNSTFENIVRPQNHPHLAFPTEANLTDKKNGISILYRLNKEKSVEVISLFEKEDRSPADLKK